MNKNITEVIKLLDMHYEAYLKIKPFADLHKQPHPTDTRGWSQILVSALTGISGKGRKKGPDFVDGSDVKGSNCWDAIDKPRFNGCLKAGTKSSTANSLKSLNDVPFLFFVMWDSTETTEQYRCRVWVVNTQHDEEFRSMASSWYLLRKNGVIRSNNFQLHPPRNKDNNVFTNNCGHLEYPLMLEARLVGSNFVLESYDENALNITRCKKVFSAV